MSDIFREVDEDVRRDRAIQFWKKYQNTLIGIAILIVLATAGWRGYQYWRTTQAQAASARFDAALDLAASDKLSEARAALDKLADSGTDGYRTLARLQAAAIAGRADPAAGVKAYDALASDATLGPLFQDVAKLRAAMLLVDAGDSKIVKQRLDALASPTAPFRHTARELLALAALKANDVTEANKWLTTILVDPATPGGLRQRAQAYLSIVRGLKPPTG